jgi:aminodeoxyfutalosine deaminase
MPPAFEDLPKAELHLHLEGSIDYECIREIEPGVAREQYESRYACGDFAGFLEGFKWAVGLLRGPDDYAMVARRLLARLERENVRYAEITLSAGVVLRRGHDFARVWDAVRREAERSRIQVRWILDAVRQWGAKPAMEVAQLAAELRGEGAVAFGIGGDEIEGPVEWFADVFRFAREQGLHVTAHAGETAGPESVWGALRLGAERIGHGIAAARDPALLAYLRDNDIALDVCISSNVATGAVACLAEHPVRRIYDAGVPIVLNTDDPAVFDTTLAHEYELAQREFGFTEGELRGLIENGFRYAFMGQALSPRPASQAGPKTD